MRWLAIFDIDGTLLRYRSVDVMCKRLGLQEALTRVINETRGMLEYEISAKIAGLFAGVRVEKMEQIFDTIPLVKGAKTFVRYLKAKGFHTAIITNSYTFLAKRLASRIGIDEVRGNVLEQVDGVVTGRIKMPMGWDTEHQPGCIKAAVCKLHEMKNLIRKYSIKNNCTLAIGDSISDICMVKAAKIGVAFRTNSSLLRESANIIIETDFLELKEVIRPIIRKYTLGSH
ncbi:MAG: HAD family hydrolase [Candidatus Ranarchaeia archaeon]